MPRTIDTLPEDVRKQLAALEQVRLDALDDEPPDCMLAVAALSETVRLLREHGVLEPPILTPEEEARLREQMEIDLAKAEVLERRFYGQRES